MWSTPWEQVWATVGQRLLTVETYFLEGNLADLESMIKLLDILGLIRPSTEEDVKRWTLPSSGCYTEKPPVPALTSPHAPFDHAMVEIIWKADIPKQVKVFRWVFIQGKLNTCDLLQTKWPKCSLSLNWCVMCNRDLEDHHHLLFQCTYAAAIWSKIFGLFGITWCFLNNCSVTLNKQCSI